MFFFFFKKKKYNPKKACVKETVELRQEESQVGKFKVFESVIFHSLHYVSNGIRRIKSMRESTVLVQSNS